MRPPYTGGWRAGSLPFLPNDFSIQSSHPSPAEGPGFFLPYLTFHVQQMMQGKRRVYFCSRKLSPTNTRSVSERSPMIFLIGSGNFLTKVGIARIWSPLAN